ncbi:MAG: sulfatase [Elusimicrobiota bacterium]
MVGKQKVVLRILLSSVTVVTFMRSADAKKPNVVLIVADDLGYNGLSIQECHDIATPNIDSIAKDGVRFTNGYVSCPVCSPSRAGFITGRYQQRFGHEFNPGTAVESGNLVLTEKTLAEQLKPAGYVTGIFGKWHLGRKDAHRPLQRGFDNFFGFLGGAHMYMNYKITSEEGYNNIYNGNTPVEDGYTTDVFTREAVKFIDNNAVGKTPFFLYLPYNAVHLPLQTTPEYLSKFNNITDPKRRQHAAMLTSLDDNIGYILATLKKYGLENDTIVIFISDNGGPTLANTSSNLPFRGYKGNVLEGGIRVPFMIKWPGKLTAGKIYNEPVISLDIVPTVLSAAGIDIPVELDGVNLMPYITAQKNSSPHNALFWRYGMQKAVRSGEWKLETTGIGTGTTGKNPQKWELYNLAIDLGEENDVAAANPDIVNKLYALYTNWEQQMIPPKWSGKVKTVKKKKKG